MTDPHYDYVAAEVSSVDAQAFALLHLPSLPGSGTALAYRVGDKYLFSDGRSFTRFGDLLRGQPAVFFTHAELEQMIGLAIQKGK